MKTKKELLEELQERVGNILNLLREEIKFSNDIEQKLDILFELIKEEANEIIKDETTKI